MNVEGEFGKKLRENIDSKKNSFKMPEGKCAFLNSDNLCGIYKELGEETMCYTCKIYPRCREDYAQLVQLNIMLSCPEVARIIISNPEKITFEYFETDKIDVKQSINISKISPKLYDAFFQIQNTSIDIMQHRELSLYNRLMINLLYAKKVQSIIDKNTYHDVIYESQKYENTGYLYEVSKSLAGLKVGDLLYVDLLYLLMHSDIALKLLVTYSNNLDLYNKYILNLSRNEFMEFLSKYENEFEEYMRDRTYEYENYFVQLIYSTYMKMIKERNILKAVIINNISFPLIKIFSMLCWIDNGKELTQIQHATVIASFAKTYLHGKEGYDKAYRLLSNGKYNQLSYQSALVKTTL